MKHRNKTLLATLAGLILAAGLSLTGTSAAFATPSPGPSAGQTADIAIGYTLSWMTNLPTFQLTGANDVSTNPAGATTGAFTIQNNSPGGYEVMIQGPPNFGSNVPTGDISWDSDPSGHQVAGTLTTDPQLLGNVPNEVTSGDVWNTGGFWLSTLPAAGSTGTGVITFTLWAD